MKFLMRIGTPFTLVMSFAFAAQAQMWGTGMWGGMQACSYPYSAAEGASSYQDEINEAQAAIKEAQSQIRQKKSEKKRADRDWERAERDINDVISEDYSEFIYEHIKNNVSCKEYQGLGSGDEFIAQGQEGDAAVQAPGSREIRAFTVREWSALCDKNKSGSVSGAVCDGARFRQMEKGRATSQDCKKALTEHRKKYALSNKLQREIEALENAVARYKDDIKDSKADLAEERREAQRERLEGGVCIDCVASGSGYTYQKPETDWGSVVGNVVLGLGMVGMGYQTNKMVARANSNIGWPTDPYPAYLAGMGPLATGIGQMIGGGSGIYGAIGGGIGAGGFGCAGNNGGPYGMMGPYGGMNGGGMWGNPYGMGVMNPMGGLGGGIYMPGMGPWGMAGPWGMGGPYGGGMMGAYLGGIAGGMGMMGAYPGGMGMMGAYPGGMGMMGAYPGGMGMIGGIAGGMGMMGAFPGGMGMMGAYPGGMGMGAYPGGMIGGLGGGIGMMGAYPGGMGMGVGFPGGIGMMGGYPGGILGGLGGGLGMMGAYPGGMGMGGLMGAYPGGMGMAGMGGMMDGGIGMQMQQQMMQMQMQQYQMYIQQQQAYAQQQMQKQQVVASLQQELYGLLYKIQQVQMGVGTTGYLGGGTTIGIGGGTAPGIPINSTIGTIPGSGGSTSPIPAPR